MKKDYSRRQFLAHSAGIAGASIGFNSGAAAGVPAAPLRLGFVGVGDRGRHLLSAALRLESRRRRGELSLPALTVGAVCDVDPANLRRAIDAVSASRERDRREAHSRNRPRGFTRSDGLWELSNVDAWVLATPVHLHATASIDALRAGRHVYCEKPVGLNPNECLEVLATAAKAQEAGVIYQTGLQRRYSVRYQSSLQFLRDGGAGDVRFLRAQWHTSGSPKAKPWLHKKAKSGDIVLEQACHQFDVFNWVFDATPLRVCGLGGALDLPGVPPGRDTLDHYGAVLEYPGGAKVHFSQVTFAVPDRRFSGIYELVFGDRAGVDLGNAMAWDKAGETIPLKASLPKRGRPVGESKRRPSAVSDTESALLSFFRDAVAGQRPAADARVGHDASVAAYLCGRAIEGGATLSWEEVASI